MATPRDALTSPVPATGAVPGWAVRLRPLLLLGALAVIVLLAWPVRTYPLADVDASFIVGLHQAASAGLQFGTEIVATYGPLGLLGFPEPFLGPTSAAAFVVTGIVYLLLAALLLRAVRRQVPLVPALVVTFILARAFQYVLPFGALQLVVFALCVELLRRDEIPRPAWLAAGTGALAAAMCLGKLNDGVFAAAMLLAVCLVLSPRRLRSLAAFGVAFLVAGLGLWLITGQDPRNLLEYVRSSAGIISGYSEAMGLSRPGATKAYVAFAVSAATVVGIAIVAGRALAPSRRIVLALVVALLLFATWKFAFVRFHLAGSFVTLAYAVILIAPTGARWRTFGALAITTAAFVVATAVGPGSFVAVAGSVRTAVRETATVLRPWRWDAASGRTRAKIRAVSKVPDNLVAQMKGRTVHIDPWRSDVAAAYPDVTWRPMPVYQSYSAYTAGLDQLDAEFIRSPERPELILRNATKSQPGSQRQSALSIDGRFYWFESPAATLERVCRYREVSASPDWQLLQDTGSSCGAPVPLGTVTARPGEAVPVPAAPGADQLVAVRVHGVADDIESRVEAAAWRLPRIQIRLDDERYRLVPGTAAEGLLLAVPAAAQGSEPFSFGPPVRSIAVDAAGTGGGPLTYEFFALPMGGAS